MTKVFISYSRKDMVWVDWLVADLRKFGVEVWLDRDYIRTGEVFGDIIEKGIESVDIVCVVVSVHSAASDYVLKEIKHAIKVGKTLAPIMLDDSMTLIDDKLVNERATLGQYNGRSFQNTYMEPFQQLLKDLSGVALEPEQYLLHAAIASTTGTAREFAQKVWLFRNIPFNGQKCTGLLIDRTGYGAEAYLVVPSERPFEPPNPVQAFLQFAGEPGPSDAFLKYLGYLITSNKKVWTILVRGPQRKLERKGTIIYDLPIEQNDNRLVWERAAAFAWRTISDNNGGQTHTELYLDVPTALAAALMCENRTNLVYDIFHYIEDELDIKKQYVPVYTSAGRRK